MAVLFVLILYFYILISIRLEVKAEIEKVPKVPMAMCDTHGAFPESALFHTTAVAEDRPDLDVPMCPFCMADRLKASEKLLKG